MKLIPSPLPYIRTASLAIAGAILTFLVSLIPGVGAVISYLAALGISRDLIVGTLSGILIVAYYAVAKQLGKRWPNVERWMLNMGSSSATTVATIRRHHTGAILRPADPRNIPFAKLVTIPTVATTGFVGTRFSRSWGVLANMTVGDCVVAFMMHAVMLTNFVIGIVSKFSPALALKLYSRLGGYVPGDPSTDNGLDPIAAIKDWQKNGIVDSAGRVNKLVGYATIATGDFNALRVALDIPGIAVGVMWNLPKSALSQFPSRKWTYVPGSPDDGGHATLASNDNGSTTGIVTWGAEVQATHELVVKCAAMIIVLITEAAPASIRAAHAAELAAIRKVA